MAQIPYAICNGKLTAIVELKSASDVFLVDESNYRKFKTGQKFKYYGGHYTQTPVRITVERHGRFYLIVRGSRTYSYKFI